MPRLDGQTVVVGGGAGGVGRAVVDALLHDGARVVVPSRTEAAAERFYLEADPECVPRLRTAVGDLADPHTTDRIAAVARREFGGVDHVVSALGSDRIGPLVTLAGADVHRALAASVSAPGILILGLLRHLNGAAPAKRVIALTVAPAATPGSPPDAWSLGRALSEGLVALLRESPRPGVEFYALRVPFMSAPESAPDPGAEAARIGRAVAHLIAEGAPTATVDAAALAP